MLIVPGFMKFTFPSIRFLNFNFKHIYWCQKISVVLNLTYIYLFIICKNTLVNSIFLYLPQKKLGLKIVKH